MREEGLPLPHRRLEIVVARECLGCEEARHLAREMQERFPTLDVVVTELDGQRPVPAGVVATPAYLIDGQVVFLGNPYREALVAAITGRVWLHSF